MRTVAAPFPGNLKERRDDVLLVPAAAAHRRLSPARPGPTLRSLVRDERFMNERPRGYSRDVRPRRDRHRLAVQRRRAV